MASFPNLQFNFLNGEKDGQDLIGLARLSPYIFVGGNHPEYMTVDGYNRTPTLKHFRVNVSELGVQGLAGSKSILDLDTRNLYFGHNTKTFSEAKIVIGEKGRMSEGFTVKGLPVRLQQVHFRAALPNNPSNEYSAYFLVSDPVGGNYYASPFDNIKTRVLQRLANSDYKADYWGSSLEFKSMDWASGETVGSRYNESIVDFSSRMIIGDQLTIGRQNLWDEKQRAPFNDGDLGEKFNMARITFDETSLYLTQNGENDQQDGNGYVLPLSINVASTVVANTGYFSYDALCRQYQEWNINLKHDGYAEKFDSVVLDFMPKYRLDDNTIDGKVVEDVPIMVRKPPPVRNSVILSKNGKSWSTGVCPTDFSFRCTFLNEEKLLPIPNEVISAYVKVRGGLVHLGSFLGEHDDDQVLVVEGQNKVIRGDRGYIWLHLERYHYTSPNDLYDFYSEWIYYIITSNVDDNYKNNSDTQIWILLAEVTNIGEDARGECMGIIHHQCGDIRLEEGVGAGESGRETAFPAKISAGTGRWYFQEAYTNENDTGFTVYGEGEGREGYLLEVNNFPAPDYSKGPTDFYAHVVEDKSPSGELSYSFEYPFDNIFLAKITTAEDRWYFNEAIPQDPQVSVGFYTRKGYAIEINGILPHQDNTEDSADGGFSSQEFYAYIIQYETDPKTYYFSYPLQKGEYPGQVLTWGGSAPRWKNPRVFPATISVSGQGDQFSFLEIHTGTESGDALRQGFCYEANSIKCNPSTKPFVTLVWEDIEVWNPSPTDFETDVTAKYYFNLPVLFKIDGVNNPSPYDVLRINEGGEYWEWGCVQVGTPESSGTDESSGS